LLDYNLIGKILLALKRNGVFIENSMG